VFVGTLIISLFRSPKILDDKRMLEIDGLRKENEQHRATIATQAAPRFPPKLEAKVRKFISDHPHSPELFEYFLVHGEWEDRALKVEQDGPALIASGILKQRKVAAYYGGADYAYSIADLYQPIVRYILYENDSPE